MEWLNYHHLLYFWTVARKGSMVKASEELLLAPPTISAQIGKLEESLGEKLFRHSGRRLVLTETGQVVFRYAEEIFSTGRELMDTLKGRPTGRPLQLLLGIVDVLPKALVYRLIEPAFHLPSPVQIVCREDPPDRMLGLLAMHQLDLILSDAPMPAGTSVRAFNHLLGDCAVGFYTKLKGAEKLRKTFPRSLEGAPMLLPTESASLRGELEKWFDSKRIRPVVAGAFDDFALLRVFASAGHGIFAAPSMLDREMRRSYGFVQIGSVEEVRMHFYAISVERRIKNPAVVAISEAARHEIFR